VKAAGEDVLLAVGVGGGLSGLAERGSVEAAEMAASETEVILDTDAVIRYDEASALLQPGETPVITDQVAAELNDLVSRGSLDGMPNIANQLKVVEDTVDVSTQAQLRSTLGQFAGDSRGSIGNPNNIRGLNGDGIIGTTGILTNRAIITADRAFYNALVKVGGAARGLGF
jgi:hypothetical protein